MRFRHDYVLGSGGDEARVEISTDAGKNWTGLESYSSGGNVPSEEEGAQPWADIAWKDEVISLAGYAGQEVCLRFSLKVDGGASDKGWVIDNVLVSASD